MNRYLRDFKLEEVLSDEAKFEVVLDRVVSAAIEKAVINIPKIILAQVKHAEATQKLVEEFYSTNRDLKKYKPLIGTTVTRLYAENPGMAMDELLKLAAVEVRQKTVNSK